MMRHFALSLYFCLTFGLSAAVTTEDVLGQMDQSSGKFTGLAANLVRVTYTKVIDEKTTESGTILLKKKAPKDIQVLIDIVKPDLKTVSFKGAKAEIFYPKLKTVQEYDVGKQRGLVDQFMLVGFGTPGKDLKANYSIKYGGEETIAGQRTHKLEMTPKSDQWSDKLRQLELWIAESGAYPVQQKFIQPSGDFYLFTYSAVKLNPELTDENLKLKLPKGVKRERVQ
jgi:outer membrane lipoprotein-sorting protein